MLVNRQDNGRPFSRSLPSPKHRRDQRSDQQGNAVEHLSVHPSSDSVVVSINRLIAHKRTHSRVQATQADPLLASAWLTRIFPSHITLLDDQQSFRLSRSLNTEHPSRRSDPGVLIPRADTYEQAYKARNSVMTAVIPFRLFLTFLLAGEQT